SLVYNTTKDTLYWASTAEILNCALKSANVNYLDKEVWPLKPETLFSVNMKKNGNLFVGGNTTVTELKIKDYTVYTAPSNYIPWIDRQHKSGFPLYDDDLGDWGGMEAAVEARNHQASKLETTTN